ncbi:de-hypoxanthine futalosine cyclase [Desulfobotulus alkaliphilus]|uniref:Cyclic dehypoxanthine futalosine synthase n=1 Tax=Desulfobotulus alkaliphilus TaxID=622671 RepID=A0A562R6Z5_9BACT|nr:cyclic dehypoxanthinyl futalosine synthase [Desulfobotulus alkaliphilus]TWI64825.1 de-hypoxanthine futalosine cyclase [Desulfobotulus alkaliphilus]
MERSEDILGRAIEGERISMEEGLYLLEHGSFPELGAAAHAIRCKRHGGQVSYVVDRNINYTNACVSGCLFCAFYRDRAEKGAYVLGDGDFFRKIEETFALGGSQILLQGGMHPELDLVWQESLLRRLKEKFPTLHIHGYSPPEIAYFADQAGVSDQKCIQRLVAAGLDSIPGGGAEILVDRVRREVSPGKCLSDRWLSVMRDAHGLGLRTTATMMFGHKESRADILTHMDRLRRLQDETSGFTAFIPWTFQSENTRLSTETATSVEYLKVLALSRIYLDNFDNIQASWVTQGEKIAQTALFFGANDMGSTMIEENVVAAAGVSHRLSLDTIQRLIRDAGFDPVQRNCFYQFVSV